MVDLSEEPRWGRVAESSARRRCSPVGWRWPRSRASRARTRRRPTGSARAPSTSSATASSAGGRDYDTVSVGENTLRNLHLRPFRDAVDGRRACGDGVVQRRRRHPDARARASAARRAQGRVGLRRRRRRRLERRRPDRQPGGGRATSARRPGWPSRPASTSTWSAAATSRTSPPWSVDGEVDEALVDDACRRVLRMKFRLGLFDGAAAPGTPPDRERADGRRPRDGAPRRRRPRTCWSATRACCRSRRRRVGAAHRRLRPRGRGAARHLGAGRPRCGRGVPRRRARRPARRAADGRRRPLLRPHPAAGPRRRRDRGTGRRAPEPLGRGQLGLRPPAASRPARPAALARRAGQAAGRRGLHRPAPRPHRGPRPRRRGAGRLAPRPRGGLGARRRAHRGRRPARPAPDDLPAVHRAHPDQHPPAADRAAHPGRRGPSRGSVRRCPDLPTAAVRLRPDLRVRRLRTPAGQRRHPGRGRLGDAVADGHQQRPAGVPRGRAGVLPRPRRAGDPAPGRALRLGGRGPGARRLRRGELRRSRRGPSPTPAPSSPSAWTTGRSCC